MVEVDPVAVMVVTARGFMKEALVLYGGAAAPLGTEKVSNLNDQFYLTTKEIWIRILSGVGVFVLGLGFLLRPLKLFKLIWRDTFSSEFASDLALPTRLRLLGIGLIAFSAFLLLASVARWF